MPARPGGVCSYPTMLPYSPIDCSLHDRLESFATLRCECRIVFRKEDGTEWVMVDRIVDVFPENQQEQVRVQLSNNLVAVLTQQLLPKAFGGGRVLAYELMIATPAVRALIREGKTHQLRSVIQTGGQYGMITMDACLADLYRRKLITYEMGLARAVDPKEFMRLAGAPVGARR